MRRSSAMEKAIMLGTVVKRGRERMRMIWHDEIKKKQSIFHGQR